MNPRSLYPVLFVAAALFVVIQSFARLAPIVLSFILILLISMAVNPVIARLRDWTGGRRRATGLVAAGLMVFLGLTAWAMFGPIKSSAGKIAHRLPGYWERLQKPLIRMEKQAQISEQKLQAEVTTEVVTRAGEQGEVVPDSLPPAKTGGESTSLRTGLTQMLRDVAGSFAGIAFNAAQILVVLVTVFFGVLFTLMNPNPIFGAIFSLVPDRHHDRAMIIVQRIGAFVPGWALATFLGMFTIGLLVFLIMWPIFGFVDALVLGVIAGVLEAVPYLGPLLSAVPALLFALGKGGLTPVWVVLAYTVVQAAENNLVSPLIVARSMKLHPVGVIFSMLLCVTVFGVLGVLIAAPMVAVIKILHEELFRKRFLPNTTDDDLKRMARQALHEKPNAVVAPG